MGAWLPYDCPEDVCKAVRVLPELRTRLGTVSAWPWNRYQPRETAWWLVPQDDEAERPAYALGKFYFEFGDEPNWLDVGLYLERGGSEAAVTALGRRSNEVFTDDWMWSRFVADLAAGKVTDAVRRVSAATGLELAVAFELKPLTSEAPSLDIEGDLASFSVRGDGGVVPDHLGRAYSGDGRMGCVAHTQVLGTLRTSLLAAATRFGPATLPLMAASARRATRATATAATTLRPGRMAARSSTAARAAARAIRPLRAGAMASPALARVVTASTRW